MVWDEYEQACRIGWTSADDIQLAQFTTEDHPEALRVPRRTLWQERG
jgi:hypothetical protein